MKTVLITAVISFTAGVLLANKVKRAASKIAKKGIKTYLTLKLA